jgi:subtilisin family serine protease
MRVLVQLRSSPATSRAAAEGVPASGFARTIERADVGFTPDYAYPAVQVPGAKSPTGALLHSLSQPLEFSMAPAESTYLVRGNIPDGSAQNAALVAATSNPDVVAVYSDPVIEPCPICPGAGPKGTDTKVAQLLAKTSLAKAKMDGHGVYLAIVDTGTNLAYLKSQGRTVRFDAAKSWAPSGVTTAPGAHPKDHGSMCAFDATIMAPKATLLDYAVLQSRAPGATQMAGLLSDAVLAYSRLRTVLDAMPKGKRAMVVSNSWGMFSPTWDFPPGHPGNYSDNPNHPFNLIVASLAAAGADILFAAGNCGRNCPDGRCAFGTLLPICGANSHPDVISVAGVDVSKERVGYSSQGPGRLTQKKPDIAAYTHFKGSGVYPADGGTSAACPVAAGVIAAVRSRYSASRISPAQLRSLVQRTAEDRSSAGYDFDYGWGILDAKALKAALP